MRERILSLRQWMRRSPSTGRLFPNTPSLEEQSAIALTTLTAEIFAAQRCSAHSYRFTHHFNEPHREHGFASASELSHFVSLRSSERCDIHRAASNQLPLAQQSLLLAHSWNSDLLQSVSQLQEFRPAWTHKNESSIQVCLQALEPSFLCFFCALASNPVELEINRSLYLTRKTPD